MEYGVTCYHVITHFRWPQGSFCNSTCGKTSREFETVYDSKTLSFWMNAATSSISLRLTCVPTWVVSFSRDLLEDTHVCDMGVSENSGTPKSSIWIGFSIINHPFWGTPIFGNTHIGLELLVFPQGVGVAPFSTDRTRVSQGCGIRNVVGVFAYL